MKNEFLRVARLLNERLRVTPLLYGSLGLQQRLGEDLHADDIDVLIPESFLGERWDELVCAMQALGYRLYDLHEHAFERGTVSCAFASMESLKPFADVDLDGIPIVLEDGVRYFLLDLRDYLKVYSASANDGYRKDVKNKDDQRKIALIRMKLGLE